MTPASQPATRNEQSQQSQREGTILPLLGDEANRQLLTGLVGDRYDVVPAALESISDPAFDLCIVDEQALAEHRDALAETKEHRSAAFLPYLLVTTREVGELSKQVQDAVDGILTLPTTKAALGGRIVNLLQRRQSEERFRRLFQAAPDPVVVIAADGHVSAANQAFHQRFGFDEVDLEGTMFADLPFSREESAEETAADGDEKILRLSWTQDKETTLRMELHATPMRQGRELVEWIGIFRDITATVNHAEQLEREQQRLNGLHWSRN